VGFVGRLIPAKGVQFILDAFSVLKTNLAGFKVILDVVGVGPWEGELRERVISEKLPVRFLGKIDNVSAFYRGIDLLIVPSLREPLGLVVGEAGLEGIPVLANSVDGIPEVGGSHVEYLMSRNPLKHNSEMSSWALPKWVYDPLQQTIREPWLLDKEEMAQKILDICESYPLFKMRALKHRDFIRQNFCIQEHNEALHSIHYEVLGASTCSVY